MSLKTQNHPSHPSRSLTLAVLMFLCASWGWALEVKREAYEGRNYLIARVDLMKDRLALFQTGSDGKPLKGFANLKKHLRSRREDLAFAMNAGMFKTDFTPLGLCISEGSEVAPINRAGGQGNFYWKPNGIFFIDDSGAHICKTENYRTVRLKVKLATQSGPMMVWEGMPHAEFKPTSTSRRIRNAVGIQSARAVVLVLSESPVTFHEMALLFRNGLGCNDALYLDGEISSIYAPSLGRTDETSHMGPILAVLQGPANAK